MSDLISTTSTVIQLLTWLRDINKNIENAEFSNVLADLSLELANLKIQVAGLLEENDKLKRQLAEKNDTEIIFKDFAYYTTSGDGPFCPACYDSFRKTIRLTKQTGAFTAFGSHSCPVCRETFGEA